MPGDTASAHASAPGDGEIIDQHITIEFDVLDVARAIASNPAALRVIDQALRARGLKRQRSRSRTQQSGAGVGGLL